MTDPLKIVLSYYPKRLWTGEVLPKHLVGKALYSVRSNRSDGSEIIHADFTTKAEAQGYISERGN